MSNFIPFPSLHLEICSGQAFIAKIKKGKVTPKILVTGLWFLHFAILLIALYQYIKFHYSTFNTFRDMLQTKVTGGRTFYANGCNSAKSDNRIMALAFCTSSIGPLSIYRVSFHSLFILSEICSGQAFYCKN